MRTIHKIVLLTLLTFGLAGWSLKSWGSYLTSGKPAPNFVVESGVNQKLSLDMVRGRVVVLLYKSRQVPKKNLELKLELKRLYRSQTPDVQRDIFRLVVIDCGEAQWPVIPFWKKSLKDGSKKESLTIYGDWNRQMLSDYGMEAEENNFLIIDRQGIIRYSATGKVHHSQFDRIKGVLASLVQDH